jgi:UDP-N-acetylglucosamine 2-epimerase
MGEDPKTVFPLGCPSADVVARAIKDIPKHKLDKLGVGPNLDLHKPFILVIFHPVTTEFNVAESQMEEVLEAIRESGLQTILLWPNIDAGSDGVSQAIRRFREFNHDFPMHAYKNFESDVYIAILARTACAVGNSSSFIRDASFLGTPVVMIGSRQDGREFCDAVHHIAPEKGAIVKAIKRQLSNGRYRPSELYGVPGVSKKIVEELVKIEPYLQKRIHYVSK